MVAMTARNKYALINWPPYLRWTVGLILTLCVTVPLILVTVLWDALSAAYRGARESYGWRQFGLVFENVLLGNSRETLAEHKRRLVARLLHRKAQ